MENRKIRNNDFIILNNFFFNETVLIVHIKTFNQNVNDSSWKTDYSKVLLKLYFHNCCSNQISKRILGYCLSLYVFKNFISLSQRLKHATPRQTDLNLEALVQTFHEKQIEMEKVAFADRFREQERIKHQQQDQRRALMARSQRLREKQSEIVAKIQ